ncbi:hypothetical protein [Streptomyces sp. NBC_01235]|uniref:hypothetical protein n=1 Tax=Streptomyces sp. NBC_01235 TaxID=2903788 RepID=UPI002E131214|nr:hypothetical protein OG289_23520 [Streptomyces sp. NBC_01235]
MSGLFGAGGRGGDVLAFAAFEKPGFARADLVVDGPAGVVGLLRRLAARVG